MRRLTLPLALLAALLLAAAAGAQAPAPGPLNVRDYGAKGDGLADDSPAIQRAIDAALEAGDPQAKVRSAVRAVYVPSGQYRLGSVTRVRSAQFLKLYGDGGSTVLRPDFTGTAALELAGVAYSTVSDLRIWGTGREALDCAIYLHWTPQTERRSVTRVRVVNVEIADTRYKVGVQVGVVPSQPVQCDEVCLSSVGVTGGWKPGEETWWQHGVRYGSGIPWGNNLAHSCFHLRSECHANGVTVDSPQLGVWGFVTQGNGTDFLVNATSYFTANGGRSERSQRLYVSGGAASGAAQHSLRDVDWHGERLHPDGCAIDFRFGGLLTLDQVRLSGCPRPPKLVTRSWVPHRVEARGLTVQGFDLKDLWQLAPKGSVRSAGFVRFGAGGSTEAVVDGP